MRKVLFIFGQLRETLALAATALVAVSGLVAGLAAYQGLARQRRVAELDGKIMMTEDKQEARKPTEQRELSEEELEQVAGGRALTGDKMYRRWDAHIKS